MWKTTAFPFAFNHWPDGWCHSGVPTNQIHPKSYPSYKSIKIHSISIKTDIKFHWTSIKHTLKIHSISTKIHEHLQKHVPETLQLHLQHQLRGQLCSFGSQTVGAQPGLGRNEKRMENAGFLHEFKGFLWDFFGISMFFLNFIVFLYDFYGFFLNSISMWFLWNFLWFLWYFYGISMEFPWDFWFLWDFYGISKGFLRDFCGNLLFSGI